GAAGTGVVLGAAGAALATGAAGLRRGGGGPSRASATRFSGAAAGHGGAAAGHGGAAAGRGGALTRAYGNGLVGPASPGVRATAPTGLGTSTRERAGRAGRAAGAVAIGGTALGAQVAQAGIVRGRALADHQTPEVDVSTDEAE